VSILVALATSIPLRDAKLIRDGEVSVGRVVLQEYFTLKSSSASLLHYAFVDSVGRGVLGEGRDRSGNIGDGAPLVVFYDPLDPNRNVALDCSRICLKLRSNPATTAPWGQTVAGK